MWMWILVILHLLLCLAAYLLMRVGILKSTPMIMPLVIFVPVFVMEFLKAVGLIKHHR